MSILSFSFFAFFIFTATVYYLIPSRFRWGWLLVCSVCFYLCSGLFGGLFLLFSTVSTFFAGKAIAEAEEKGRGRKRILTVTIALNVAVLAVWKIITSQPDRISALFRNTPIGGSIDFGRILIPLGISYYTLEAVGYLVDIYRGKQGPEKNLFRYALFLSYFPQIAQGPIARYPQLSKQLFAEHPFCYTNVAHGAQLALWGMFKKLVVADRLQIAVNTLFRDYAGTGSAVVAGALLFSIQIYADFSGCMDLVSGCSEMLGIRLTRNFDHPFSSKSFKELWKRWHISLSSWLQEYVYIPLGGNRKGEARKKINLIVTFLVSGIWHGFGAGYLAWGLLHGLYLAAEDKLSEKRRSRASAETQYGILNRIRTFVLFSFAVIFFRAPGLSAALKMVWAILVNFDFTTLMRNIYSLGLSEIYVWFLVVAISVMFLTEKYQKNHSIREELDRQPILIRWGVYLAGILVVVLMGNYGINTTGMFLYARF